MMLTIQKCDPQGFNYESYMSIEYLDICHFLNIPFFAFLKGFEPEIKSCPLRKVIILIFTNNSGIRYENKKLQGIVKNSGMRYDMSAWTHMDMQNKYLTNFNNFDEDKNSVFCYEMDWTILQKRISRRTKIVNVSNN
jgi:hypothetical protein